ncbi:MAG: hypothetical protein NZ846_11250 [Thermus sp.]|uniref:hypothetical protein n=1 Tax=Thermus sp. TaxID=275 RepID=UPI0025D0CFAA|nr:hypothetical protein [Thermus sp.]MCS7219523.1 hypothetical protein [Thermus sp.]
MEAQAQETQEPRPFYLALLRLRGTLEMRRPRKKGPPQPVLAVEGLGDLPLRPAPGLRYPLGRLIRKNLGKGAMVHLSPRTDGEGRYLPQKALAIRVYVDQEPKPPSLLVQGRLVGVDPEEGLMRVEIRPNPRGGLKEAFTLTLAAPLALLEGLPPLGGGVQVEGEMRPSGLLVARAARAYPLWDEGGTGEGHHEGPSP